MTEPMPREANSGDSRALRRRICRVKGEPHHVAFRAPFHALQNGLHGGMLDACHVRLAIQGSASLWVDPDPGLGRLWDLLVVLVTQLPASSTCFAGGFLGTKADDKSANLKGGSMEAAPKRASDSNPHQAGNPEIPV